jgi:hypothetical protein
MNDSTIAGMARLFAKVTLSLPPELLSQIDRRSKEAAESRSGFVSALLARGLGEIELAEREARYRAAYAHQPETSEELVFSEAAAADFVASSEPWDEMGIGEPKRVLGVPRRCAVNLDRIVTIDRARLEERLSTLSPARMAEVERAVHIALGMALPCQVA